MRRSKSARHLQRFVSTHDQVANLFIHSRYDRDAAPVAVSRPRRSKLTVPVNRPSPALTELA